MAEPAGKIEFLEIDGRRATAYRRHLPGTADPGACGVLFLAGFHSSMDGTKALALDVFARRTNRPFVRFDYFGHGATGGEATDFTVSTWLEQAGAVFKRLTQGPQVVVGSSMGGWLALLLARQLASSRGPDANRLCGVLLLAPATDMTAALIKPGMTQEHKHDLARRGAFQMSSDYDPSGYTITAGLLADGDNHAMLGSTLELEFPVHILHGRNDCDVPWQHSVRTLEALGRTQAELTVIENGDHRLSSPIHLNRIVSALERLIANADRLRLQAPANSVRRN